ncbi:MAG: sister chromatid cohesion protein DCC1 [archaeon]|nr:sister chromatid cohesion protein DCC1 [archaeon]
MELYFGDKYDESSMFLMEVPPNILSYIRNKEGELLIKGKDSSILCTKDKNYELKFLETSNTFMVLDSEEESSAKKEITLMTFHTLECNEMSTKKYFLYNILKEKCCLNYDLENSKIDLSKFDLKITKDEGFAMTDYPRELYEKMIKECHIFLYESKYLCIFSMEFSSPLITSLLRNLAVKNIDQLNSEKEIFDILIEKENKYQNIISQMGKEEKKNLIEYIFDLDESGKYILSLEKVKLFIAKDLFYSKYKSDTFDFKLAEFIEIFEKSLGLYLPSKLFDNELKISETYLASKECQDNVYEYYTEYDLRFLNKKCIVYMNKTFKDPLIKWIDLSSFADNFDERIKQLYQIKEKWTLKELKTFCEDLSLANLVDRINRLTQVVSEENLFNKEKKISYLYLKKNPFYKG